VETIKIREQQTNKVNHAIIFVSKNKITQAASMGTCLTDSAISGPIPSPGKRVARIGVDAEEKALGFDK
jgi:hypothetical protein